MTEGVQSWGNIAVEAKKTAAFDWLVEKAWQEANSMEGSGHRVADLEEVYKKASRMIEGVQNWENIEIVASCIKGFESC